MKFSAVGILFVVCACSPSRGEALQEKPIKDEVLYVTTSNVPLTLPAMRDRAAAIIIARYTGDSTLSEFVDQLQTNYTFEVLEIPKLHGLVPNPTQVITVELSGGRKEFPTYTVRQLPEHNEELVEQHAYLIFLQVDYVRNVLFAEWGAASVYDVSGSHVRALDREYGKYDQMTVEEFLAAVTPQ